MRKAAGPGVLLSLIVSSINQGCGGASGSASEEPIQGQTTTVGQIVAQYSGNIKPFVTSASGPVSVTGVSGAAFTNIVTKPTNNLDQTFLAMVIGGNIWTFPYPNGPASPLTTNQQAFNYCSVSRAGNIVFDALGTSLGLYNLFTCSANGSNLKQITPSGGQFVLPSWSPDGTKISALGDLTAKTIGTETRTFGNIYTMSATGTGMTRITNGQVANSPGVWSPDGKTLAVSLINGSSTNVFTIPATGGTMTNITPGGLRADFTTPYDWSVDGQSIAVTDFVSGTTSKQVLIFNTRISPAANIYTSITSSKSSGDSPCFSPDGKFVAYRRSATSSDSSSGFYVSDISGFSTALLVPDNGTANLVGVSWSKFFPQQAMIGPTGTLGATSSGFLVSQKLDVVESLVSVIAKTPSTLEITAPSNSGGTAALVFTLKADGLSQVSWINGYLSSREGFTPIAGTTQLIVSFDSQSGQMNFVAPALSGPKPALDKVGTLVGSFSAVYDRNGKNLAPQGAHRLHLNPLSGSLVSVR